MNLKLNIKKETVLIIFFLFIGVVLSFIYLKPFLGFSDTMFLRLDWHKEFQLSAATWISIANYHEFPFWNQYTNGGNFLFAHPESYVLSPETISIILFGPIKGIYFAVLVYYIIGFLGCYFIGRHLKFTFLGTLYLAVVFTFTSYVMNNLFMGASMWMPAGYIPLAFYFLMRSLEHWKYGVPAGLFHALIYFGGAIYIYMLFLLFASIFAVSIIIAKKNVNYLKGFAVFLVFSFLFASIKILPNLDIYQINQRNSEDEVIPFGFDLMKKTLLDKNQAWDIVSALTYKGVNFHFPSYGTYIGILPFLIAIAALFLWKNEKGWIMALLGTFLLYLSNFGPFYFIWEIIHAIPPFTSLTRPARSVLFFVLLLAIVGAKLISALDKIKTKDRSTEIIKKALILAFILFTFADLAKSGYIIQDNFKPWPMQPGLIKWEGSFEYYDFFDRFNVSKEQIEFMGFNYIRSMSHFNTLSNKGSVYGVYDPMTITQGKVKTRIDPEYKGEYFFKDNGNTNIEMIKRSANKISLKVKADKDDVLILNQNYHNAWKTKEGFELVNENGLPGFKIPKGEHEVHIYVFQNKFLIGLFLFIVACVSGAYIMRKY